MIFLSIISEFATLEKFPAKAMGVQVSSIMLGKVY